jgi:hypothetical protein
MKGGDPMQCAEVKDPVFLVAPKTPVGNSLSSSRASAFPRIAWWGKKLDKFLSSNTCALTHWDLMMVTFGPF